MFKELNKTLSGSFLLFVSRSWKATDVAKFFFLNALMILKMAFLATSQNTCIPGSWA